MRTPTVSVIITTWNFGRFIRDTLESLFNQTYQDFEVIVVDDGSTDDTATIMRPYLDRVTYLRREHRGHVARHDGIKVSRGKYLCFLDADDIYTPDKLELQTAFMEAHPEVDFVFSDFCTFDDTGVLMPSFKPKQKRLQRIPYRREGVHRLFTKSLFEAYLFENFVFPGSLLARRDYVVRVGMFDASLEAKIFHGRLIYTIGDAKVAYTDKVLVKRRIHRDRISAKSEMVNRAWIQLYRRFLHERGAALKLKHRLFVKYQIGKAYWRLGCAALRERRVEEGRHHFRQSLKAWPLQRLGYAGLLATFFPGRFRLIDTLRKVRWP